MSHTLNPTTDPRKPAVYQIKIKGQLGEEWSDWLGGLTITLEGGDTLLTGPVVDDAALHGLLKKVRDLGMPLLSVNFVEVGSSTTLGIRQADEPDGGQHTAASSLDNLSEEEVPP